MRIPLLLLLALLALLATVARKRGPRARGLSWGPGGGATGCSESGRRALLLPGSFPAPSLRFPPLGSQELRMARRR